MLYTRKTFSCPAASGKVSDRSWDAAFLSADEFRAKYGVEPATETPVEVPVDGKN